MGDYMGIRINKEVKLDHLITASIALVSAGFIYASMTAQLANKADKAEVVEARHQIEINTKDIITLRESTSQDITEIKDILVRMENKMDRKVDK